MPVDLMLPTSIALSLTTWAYIAFRYIHPALGSWPVRRALEPLLLLHTFRYVGLMFLIPGVTSQVLDARFAHPAAYGDLIAAVLAFVAIGALRIKKPWALGAVWIFNIWGAGDLLNAVVRGLLFTADGQMGAAYWIPATIVPLLLVTHAHIFALLVRGLRRPASLPKEALHVTP